MTAAEAPNRRESYKAMEEALTPARRVFRQVAAGRRPADSSPRLIEALNIGRATANKLAEAASAAGLRPGDVACALICATPGKHPIQLPFSQTDEDSKDLTMALNAAKAKAAPIGLGFLILDRQAGDMLIHARPFERTETNETLLSTALDDFAKDFAKR